MKLNKFIGFTIAEVLITLGIIGLIAALTIPSLMNSANDKETVTNLKKIYSILKQAYALAENDIGNPTSWFNGNATHDNIATLGTLIPYLKISKDCNSSDAGQGCFKPGEMYKNLSGNWGVIDDWGYSIRLADGMIIHRNRGNSTCSDNHSSNPNSVIYAGCAVLDVDINGLEGPNQLGRDTFQFYLTKSGIFPVGLPEDEDYSFDDTCIARGDGCTAWVIYNENLDYLKSCGSTLSWNGSKSCN